MVTEVTPISTPPTPSDPPAVFEERAAQVWADLHLAVPQMNQQASDVEAIGQAAEAAKKSAQLDSDSALAYRNEARASRDEALGYKESAAQSSAASNTARAASEAAAGNAIADATRAEDAASRAEGVLANAVQQTSQTGAALLPQGTDAQRPAAGGIPAGSLVVRGNTQSGNNYFAEFWNRSAAAWHAFASQPWVKSITDALTGRIALLEATRNLNTGGEAPYYGARAYVNFDGKSTVPSIRSSENVSSITRNGVGLYTVNFITNMRGVGYAPSGLCQIPESSTGGSVAIAGPLEVGRIKIGTIANGEVDKLMDAIIASVVIFE